MTSLNDFSVTDNVTDVLAAQYNLLLGSILRGEISNATTMSGTLTLADGDTAIQRLNCDGANRIVQLPAVAAANHPFVLINVTGAAYTLEIQTSAGVRLLAALQDGQSALCIPDGSAGYRVCLFGLETDYLITPSVASNNLTLTLTHADGGTPSATRPLWVKIGSAWHAITAALSVTKNAATNWCNAGGAELATQEVDYFAYLGYNATDGVVIGFARIPYATVYSTFNTTSTDERYCAISNIAHAAATDDYAVIGRFAATLSAGAGYTWTVPTYTAVNLIQRPIFETRYLTWAPVLTGITIGNGNQYGRYMIFGRVAHVSHTINFGSSTSVSGAVGTVPPILRSTTYYDTVGASDINPWAQARLRDSSSAPAYTGAAGMAAGSISVLAMDASATYTRQAVLSSTVPFTWATDDQIDYEMIYEI